MAATGRRAIWAGAVGLVLLAQPALSEDPVVPPEQEGTWRLVLKSQLKQEKNCDLNEILMYDEIPLGEDVAMQGKVSCLDNRQFDFSRNRKHQKFRIELCEPTVC